MGLSLYCFVGRSVSLPSRRQRIARRYKRRVPGPGTWTAWDGPVLCFRVGGDRGRIAPHVLGHRRRFGLIP